MKNGVTGLKVLSVVVLLLIAFSVTANAATYTERIEIQQIEEKILRDDFGGAVLLCEKFLGTYRHSRSSERVEYLRGIAEKKTRDVKNSVKYTNAQTRVTGSGIANYYIVQIGAFKDIKNANKLAKELNTKGFETTVTKTPVAGGYLYKLRLGKFKSSNNAAELVSRLKANGYLAEIINE